MASEATGAVFKYPGSKTLLASWIIDHFPRHEVYVEGFGGSAAVLTTKPRSPNEILNDVDGDVVHFFETLRDCTDELVEWARNTPFSRELHKKYAHEFYQGLRPVDDVERAGRFFYLRYSQFAQKYTDVSGFRQSTEKNTATEYTNRVEQLYQFRDRLRDVQIESLDYAELVERTDTPDTLYYFDPPYVNPERPLYTGHDGFDHERLVSVLEQIDGCWIVSYRDLPEGLEQGYHVSEKDVRGTMRSGQGDWSQDNTERLVLNFDPKDVPAFSGPGQATLLEGEDRRNAGGDA